MRRGLRAGLVAAVLTIAPAAVVLLAPAGQAAAHAGLDGSTPASGSVLEEGPTELVLDFDEPVETDLGGVELSDATGAAVDIGDPERTPGDPSRLVVPDVPPLDVGLYVVVWEVTSNDGHPATGAFTFQVGTGAVGDADALLQAALQGRSADTAVRWVYGTIRFASFALLSVLVGVTALGLAARRDLGRRARRAVGVSLGLLALTSLLTVALQGAYVTGGSLPDALDPGLWGDVAGTRLGTAVLVRVALLAVTALVLRRRIALRVTFPLLAAGLVLTFSASGHPSASSPAALGVALDAVHLACVALWLGGLVGLVLASSGDDDAVTRRFSTIATVSVPVIVVTGSWQTWHLLGDLSDVTETRWGQLLLVKVCLAVVVITLGAVSRWLLQHDGATAIRRLVVTEIVVGGLVLGVTAGLVATPPTPPTPSQQFSATLVQGTLIAEVTVTPGRVGSNEIHVVFSPPGGALQQVVSASARVSLPAAGLPAVPVALDKTGPNHYTGIVQLPEAGDWQLDLVVEPEENSTVLLSTTVPIPG